MVQIVEKASNETLLGIIRILPKPDFIEVHTYNHSGFIDVLLTKEVEKIMLGKVKSSNGIDIIISEPTKEKLENVIIASPTWLQLKTARWKYNSDGHNVTVELTPYKIEITYDRTRDQNWVAGFWAMIGAYNDIEMIFKKTR